jgi:hypothetical protein
VTNQVAGIVLVLSLFSSFSFTENPEVRQRVEEWAAAWSSLEPERKQKLTDTWRHAIERVQGLAPERQEEM